MTIHYLLARMRAFLASRGIVWVALFFMGKFLLKVLLIWLFLNFIQ